MDVECMGKGIRDQPVAPTDFEPGGEKVQWKVPVGLGTCAGESPCRTGYFS